MSRNKFRYTLQSESNGSAGNQGSNKSDAAKLQPDMANSAPAPGLAEADSEEGRIASGPAPGDTTPEMDADSSKPGTGDLSGRAVGDGEKGAATGG